MSAYSSRALETALKALPLAYPGPGGAVAVIREGEVLARHTWGFANAERRIAFTPQSLFRICSISKQFTCAAVLDACPDPCVLDPFIARRLPRLEDPAPGALHLCHNQSGLRDYWAVAMLHGAGAEDPFGETEARAVIGGARTLQFPPGARYAYCNQNFRLLGDCLAEKTARSFAALLRERVFGPAGMESAMLAADTRALPDGTEGYEGDQISGFRPARNQILWTGDAGVAASLDDMIAWERHIDQGREDPMALYQRLSAPVTFADQNPAAYGFGLSRRSELGLAVTGHGGALRGWRSHRFYAPAERLSVVVLFNHMADAHAAALGLFAAALGLPIQGASPAGTPAESGWFGAFIEAETGLLTRVTPAADGGLLLRFGHHADRLASAAGGAADGDGVRLVNRADGPVMERRYENHTGALEALPDADGGAIEGIYRCQELDADLVVEARGGALYGAFAGFLGRGRMELLEPIGQDVWVMPCPRALDHTPPGDWTLRFMRGSKGEPSEVRLGCWLARGLSYGRVA